MKEQDYESDYSETEEEDDDEEKDCTSDPYQVKCQKTNKDGLLQPRCCEIGILPKLPFGMAICGVSGSGKSQAMIHLMTSPHLLKGAFDFIYLWTGVKADEEMIEALELPKDCIKNDFKEEEVEEICNKLQATIEKNGFKKCPSVCFIFDDVLNKPKFLKSPTMIKLATACRHLNCSYILLSQYYKKIPPVVRTNCAYLMFFPASLQEVEKLAEECTPPNMSKKEFIKKVQYATDKPFQFLGVNNKAICNERLRKGFNEII